MTYYTTSQYNERYFFEFKDLKGGTWRVSIEDPTFSGTATELTASEEPLEWMGEGDEDQTTCILGSTGTIRLIATAETESEFTLGGILPTAANNRRVTARRAPEGSTTYDMLWQGFIKCESYSQDYISAPYEVEIPIISALAATEYINMPDWDDVKDGTYTEVISIIRLIINKLGVDVARLYSNQPEYIDYNGNRIETTDAYGNTYYVNWTQGDVGISTFYDFDATGISPKSMKDVLEILIGGVTRLREYNGSWYAYVDRWNSNEKRYYIRIDGSDNVFGGASSIDQIYKSDLELVDTDNKITILPAPSSVKYSRSINNESTVFELSAENTKVYTPDISRVITYQHEAENSLLATIPSAWVYTETVFNYFDYSDYPSGSTSADPPFCRMIKVAYDEDTKEYTYSDVVGLGMMVNSGKIINFTPSKGVFTRKGYNKLRLSFTIYFPNVSNEPIAEDYKTITAIMACVKDGDKYLTVDGEWTTTEATISNKTMKLRNNAWTLDFYEDRSTGDKSPHYLTIAFYGQLSVYTIVDVKLEYIEDTTYTDEHTKIRIMKDIKYNNDVVNVGGTGDSVEVEFKTMCGDYYTAIDGAADIPFNSACDKCGMIDEGQREMLDLAAVRYDQDPVALVKAFVYVNNGNTHYIPTAVGMNARDCTTQIKLISTNNR